MRPAALYTTSGIKKIKSSWLRFRIASFAFGASTTLLACAAVVGWIIVDASFACTVAVVGHYIGWQPIEPSLSALSSGYWDTIWSGLCSWDNLGPRLLLIILLAIVAAVASLVMLYQFLRQITIRRILVILLVFSVWLGVGVSRSHLHEWSIFLRTKNALPRFEQVAEVLHQQWPTEDGTLPEAGSFYVPAETYPDLLLLKGRCGFPIREDFGYLIERSEQGAILFQLCGATEYQIEYHPNLSQPSPYQSRTSRQLKIPRKIVTLKDY